MASPLGSYQDSVLIKMTLAGGDNTLIDPVRSLLNDVLRREPLTKRYELTPRAALDLVYRLKGLVSE